MESENIDEGLAGLLDSLWQEVPDKTISDPLHNRFINLVKDKKGVVVPSKSYVFRDLSGIVQGAKLHIDRRSLPTPAECTIEVIGNDQFHDVLKLIKKISKYQQVLITWLCIQHAITKDGYIARMLEMRSEDINDEEDPANIEELGPGRTPDDGDTDPFLAEMMKDAVNFKGINDETVAKLGQDSVTDAENNAQEIDQLITNYIVLSNDIKAIRLENCDLSPASSNYILKQLQGCNQITELDLSSVKEIPEELSEAISRMTLLRMATICNATQPAAKSIMSGLANCQYLEMLELNGNILTDTVEKLFGDSNHCGFPSLNFLHLSATKLCAADLKAIAAATSSGKLPALKQLDLSDNILTRLIQHLVAVEYPSLENLWLDKTQLSKADVRSLSEAVHEGRIPELKDLNLADNTLTDCMKILFGGSDHYGFNSLVHFKLENTKLSADDLTYLTEAVKSDKLPELIWLYLQKNKMCLIQPFVETLVQTCVTRKKEMLLYLDENDISDEFHNRIEALCQGSKIHIMENQDSYY